ncbi:MAG TPA: phosphate acyltransferase PlsX [Syntrophomonas sp.]|jgi:glycerol-3-phosphate acyltransferase PlsX|nr:phosphate acyltransferase PlsX [Syntrophomonas sp.]HCF70970.1 phosphate acyltransferase PlsX [Syntrophomonas sp.]
MKIAIDVMGGDFAPGEIIAGACKWAEQPGCHAILVGKEAIIKQELGNFDPEKLTIINADEVIQMDESVLALRKKKKASIAVATKLVHDKTADAVLSCGSTAAQMASALFILGRFNGIDRPPIVASIPGPEGKNTLLIDVGANVDCKPAQMLQFAVLGKSYAAAVMGRDNPVIGLLNNGSEETKGNALALEAYSLLKNEKILNFIGNIEGRDLFGGSCDVVVCDGFTGNIVLKALEGLGLYLGRAMVQETGKVPAVLHRFDYSNVGGAPLLGVEGVSIVCHGSSKRDAVFSGLNTACDCVTRDIVNMQKEALKLIAVD